MSRYIDADAMIANALQDSERLYLESVAKHTPSIDIVRCKECKLEWTQKCPPHRMGLVHDESDYCSYGIRKGADDE